MELTFNTEQKVNNAQKQIWVNYLEEVFAQNKSRVGTGITEYDFLDELSDKDKEELKVYGEKNGMIVKDYGLTLRYLSVRKAYNLDKWYFKKPGEKFMKNVTDYQEEEYNEDWEAPMNEFL